MSTRRTTGPRVSAGTGPRIQTAQPASPTLVQLGEDRVLIGAREVNISQLSPDPSQPRKNTDPARLEELASSITLHGVLQALLVHEETMGQDGDMRYTIIAGERRYAAIKLAIARAEDEETRRRLSRVPIVIRNSEATERRVLQLIENLQREDLPPLEEAHAIKSLMELENLTTTGVAARIHRSQGYVDERLRLLRHEEVEKAVAAGVLTRSAAAAVASIDSADERRTWIERAQAGEVVRPSEVYASKPNRRRGKQVTQPASGTEASAPLDRPQSAEQEAPLDRQVPSRRPVAEQGQDPSRALPKFGNGAQPAIDTVPDTDIMAPLLPTPAMDRDTIMALIVGASPHERSFAERLLEAGATNDWSCAKILACLRVSRDEAVVGSAPPQTHGRRK